MESEIISFISKLYEIEVIKHCHKITIDLHLAGLIRLVSTFNLSPSIQAFIVAAVWLQTHLKLLKNAVLACSFCPCIVIPPNNEIVGCLLLIIRVLKWSLLVLMGRAGSLNTL